MDTNAITHVSLCSGYGGIDLGLKRAIGRSLRTVAYVEVESFAVANLVAKASQELLDEAPVWSDLRSFPWGKFHGLVDILSGGYPCQPFSAAGKRLGAEDARHLWPFIAAGIAAMRPSVCFFENVEGHISLGLPDVLQDLVGLGYKPTWCVASASECLDASGRTAPHQRKRVFILAHRVDGGRWQDWLAGGLEPIRGRAQDNASEAAQPSASELAHRDDARQLQHSLPVSANQKYAAASCGGTADNLDNANAMATRGVARILGGAQGQEQGQGLQWQRPGHAARYAGEDSWPSRPGEQQFWWEPPRVVVDAKSQRADRRLDVCDEERRPGQSLQSESYDTGREDGAVGHTGSQRCEQAERDVRGEQQPSGTGEECGLGVAEAMGNAEELRRTRLRQDNASDINEQLIESANASERQTQPPLGRDADGPAGGLGYADLCESCANRTDELRLLGNGVVPATAERAFRILVGELMEHANQ